MHSGLEKAPVAYAFVDHSLVVRQHNLAAGRWAERQDGSAVGLNFIDLLSPELVPQVEPMLQRALAGEQVSYERSILTPTGPRSSIANYVPELDDQGAVIGIHMYVWDTTGARMAELAAKTSRDRFEGAFRYSAVGMAIVGPDGSFMDANPALTRMLGYTREEILATDFQHLTHPDDLTGDLDLLQKLIDGTADAYNYEKRYITSSGNIVWGILSVSVVREADGTVAHFVSQIQDITERKEAEEKLYQEHELSEVTLRSIGDGVITTDEHGAITYLNPVAEELTGWTTELAAGRDVCLIFDVRGADEQRVTCPMTRALQTGSIVELEANSMLRRRDGSYLPIEDSAAPIRSRSGDIIGGVLVFQDVSKRRALAMDLEFLAHHDSLTGLPNRTLFKARVASALDDAKRSNSECAVLFCDIDRFKTVNDTHGHAVGDEVLKKLAERLLSCVRSGDTVCRWSGDEFTILLPKVHGRYGAKLVADRVVKLAREPIFVDETEANIEVGISVGVSIFPNDADNATAMMSAADSALYEVKRGGRNAYAFHSAELDRAAQERLFNEARLREALNDDLLEVHYQPQISLADGSLNGVEALVRIRHQGELIYPGDFIGIAEETGLIHDLSRKVFRAACRQVSMWQGTNLQHLKVSVNLSALRLRSDEMIAHKRAALEEFGLSASQFELEITESVLVGSDRSFEEQLNTLSSMGFRLSLDDFGTGFSNLAYLRQLPVQTLKIDRSFVSRPDVDTAIVRSVIGLAHSFGKTVVAEGVETADQEASLRRLGCDDAQGYLYGKAMTATDLAKGFGKDIKADHRKSPVLRLA
ncbi:sensor domain-containing protein [Pseudoroseicyclus sp. H15]